MTVENLVAPATPVPADARQLAAEWLSRFEAALIRREASAAPELFRADSWWRDLLATGWEFHTFHGAAEIAGIIAASDRIDIVSAVLDPRIEPRIETVPEGECVLAFLALETAVGHARGVLRLREDGGLWRAWTLMTGLDDLAGHEQARGPRRPLRTPAADPTSRVNWRDWREARLEFRDHEPEVLVIGSGHGGLMTAAHLGFWGVDTLVVERNHRVGDNWRNRYRSLVLHDAIWADHLPGLPFPDSWPIYMPKDKLGDWLEFYSRAMELNVWTSTQITDASYDDELGRWTVRVRRQDGSVRTVKPQHIVVAIGVHGTPRTPSFAGMERYAGRTVHSSMYTGEEVVAGTRALIIGAGNSAHDVAQDLAKRGFDVTMLQRSSTYIISQQQNYEQMIGKLFHEGGMPTEDADLLGNSFPYLLQLARAVDQTKMIAEIDRTMLDGLARAGYRADMGIDGGGGLSKILYGPGGYYLDVGCAQLIIDGKVRITHSPVSQFTETGVAFDDGTVGDYDLVVLATGYTSPRETARTILGPEVDRTRHVWGLSEDGEVNGIWRPSGHPGLWFMGGPLYISRFYSRFLALQVHATVRGIRPRG